MPYEHLADFLTELEDAGELVRVRVVVDPVMELAALVERVGRPGPGPAILFEQVRGSAVPAVANLLGSPSRLCRALGLASLDDLSARIAGLLQPEVPEGVLESLRMVPRFVEMSKLPPRLVKAGACQQVVRMGRDVDLRDLPIPRSWHQETGPAISAGVMVTAHPARGVRSLDLVPLEVRTRQTLAVHFTRSDAAQRNFAIHQSDGRQMPVAIVLGGDPATMLSAAAPLPDSTDAYLFSGFLRGRGVDVVKCRTHDLQVPADADMVIEGFLDPATPAEPAGTVALPTGFYSLPGERPILTVTALTQRSNPVFPIIVGGPPPNEYYWMNKAVERMLQPIVRLFVPEVVDVHFPAAGGARNLVFVSVRKEYAQQAKKVMNALWGLGPLSTTKTIVVVDAEVDPHDEEDVWFRVASNVHAGRDVVLCEGPTHPDDHAAPLPGVGHKLGLDATRKLADEGHRRPWPDAVRIRPETEQLLASRWREYGLPESFR